MAALALVLGILATICPFLFFISANFIVFAIPLALTALLLAILARRSALHRSQPTGMATFAVVLGVIPLLLSAGMLVMYARVVGGDQPFAPRDANEAGQKGQERIKNSKEFDELFNRALKTDEPRKEGGKK